MSGASLKDPQQHVVSTAGICGGKPCIAGTRIRVWDVASLAQAGQSFDEIIAHFPQLTLSDLHAALAYYYDNREAVEAQAAADDQFADSLQIELSGAARTPDVSRDGGPATP